MCNIPERLVSNIRRGELWKSISSKYKNIKKKEYRFAKFHEFVDYLIFMNKSTSEILHILMNNEGLKEKESRDLINNRRKALKKKKLRIEFV